MDNNLLVVGDDFVLFLLCCSTFVPKCKISYRIFSAHSYLTFPI